MSPLAIPQNDQRYGIAASFGFDKPLDMAVCRINGEIRKLNMTI